MKLAAGIITKVVTYEQLYVAEHRTKLTSIFLNNEGDSDIVVNLFIQFGETSQRIIGKNTVISNNEPLRFDIPHEIDNYDMIRITTNVEGTLSYIIEGTIIPQSLEDILIVNLTEYFDERYQSVSTDNSDSEDIIHITDYSTPFTGLYKGKYFFDCDESDIVFDNITFFGTIWIRNTGTVTFTGTADGGTVYCSGLIPDTVIGDSLIPDNVFPTQLT